MSTLQVLKEVAKLICMRHERGQALVIVLLSLAVVLTIVLFILARSTTDIAVSSSSAESTRAFSAAEAGVENALIIGTNSNPNFGNNTSYTATVTGFAIGQTSFNYPIELYSGDSMNVWFVSHDSKGNITPCSGTDCFTGTAMNICWGKSSTIGDTTPAIELSVFYEDIPGDMSTLKIGRTTYDPNGGRVGTNKFNQTFGLNCSVSGTSYGFTKSINFADLGIPGTSYNNPGGLLFARIRMFYNSDQPQPVGISVTGVNGSLLPSQGTNIDSTGQAGESNRRVNVFEGWPEPPEVFDFSIYSGTGLTK